MPGELVRSRTLSRRVPHIDFDVELTPDAESDLLALPVWLRDAAEEYLFKRLARNPVSESEKPRRLRFGREIGGRATHQVGPLEGAIHHLTFLFRYATNENTIIITAVGYMPVVAPEDEDC
jgi:hypothetical protein